MFGLWSYKIFYLGSNSSLRRLGLALLIFLGFYLLKKIYTRYFFKILLRICNKANTSLYSRIAVAFQKPLEALFLIIAIYASVTFLAASTSQDLLMLKLLRSALIILIAWGLYDLVDEEVLLSDEYKEKINVDRIIIPFFSKILRSIILALAICIVAQEWDYEISSLIAGLGLGGLAVALAAKDTLANFFGGMVIIMDKPFSLGDRITTPSVEGTVETISFRSTKVKTSAQALVTVPNSTLANEAIINWSRMEKRRINFSLGVTYDTSSEKLKKCIESIRKMLKSHPGVHDETILVFFEKFSESSLDISIEFFTNTVDLAQHLAIKEDINLNIMDILEKEDVSAAFPTRSIYIGNNTGQSQPT